MPEPGEVTTPDQDVARITDILAKEGVKEAVQKVVDAYDQLPGKNLISGITADGLVVLVREARDGDFARDGYFQAVALDATLPVEQMGQEKIEAKFSYNDVSRYRDGGTTTFPTKYLLEQDVPRDLKALATLPADEARAKMGDDRFPILKFYKATGGFNYPTPMEGNPGYGDPPTVGGKTLYPLPAKPSTSINKSS